MGLFRHRRENSVTAGASSGAGFAIWHDPEVLCPNTDWLRRLNSFARRSAGELLQANIPLFRSTFARGGDSTYCDAFWIVAADVNAANRTQLIVPPSRADWVRLYGRTDKSAPVSGDFMGHIIGEALLLTKTGVLCAADYEAWFTRSGTVDTKCMDMIFYNVRRDETVLSGSDEWGWYNRGRWRRDSKADRFGTTARSIRFERDFFRRDVKGPGYGTSAALSSFVKSGGSTRWPKNFYDYHSF